MRYTGRLTGITIMLLIIFAVRIYAYIYFNYSLSNPPVLGALCLVITYWVGKKYDKVKFYSDRDSLTGLYNRRFIDENSRSFLASQYDENQKLCISILDCNNFKAINDTYGHKQGDLVLQGISNLLVANLRRKDIVARLGGDEFLIIAPYTHEKDINRAVNQFKNGLQQLSEKLNLEISISSGYARYPKDAQKLEELMEIADSKMYRLKKKIRRSS